jgi:L-asparaginase
VNVSQCSEGWIEMDRYLTGLQLLETGVVNGHDATLESTIAKLMFLLGHNLPVDEIRHYMNCDLRGEITLR